MTDVAYILAELGAGLVAGVRGDQHGVVESVFVHEPTSASTPPDGSIVVAIGYPPDQARRLQTDARRTGARAVVLKGRQTPDVDDDGPAVIAIDPAADWVDVLALLRLALTHTEGISQADDPLFALAEALSGMCGGSIVIHDAAWQLVAHSGGEITDAVRTETLLARRAPSAAVEALRAGGVVKRLQKGELIHLDAGEIPGLSERYAAAVVVNGQLVATLWVTPSGVLAHGDILEGLRRAVDITMLALLRQATVAAASLGRSQGRAFAGLLSGGHTEHLVARQLQVDETTSFVLAGLRPIASDAAERAGAARRLLSLAQNYCEAYGVTALAASAADTTFLLFALRTEGERSSALRVVTDMHSRLQRAAQHRTMVSGTFHMLSEVPATRAVVEDLLSLAERRGWSGLTDSDDVAATWRLEQFREIALAHPALFEGPGMRLLEHDRAHDGNLLKTLRAYFAAVGDVRAAGAALGLHYNTVRYRLRRAAEVADFDLADSDQRLLTELQVRLLTGEDGGSDAY
ncbi:MAG TPA: helix-turn-helix domain-containing protein [Mycobacteriales bacterium]|nr:helix-turn-helix domain-containing protein [Mycobacteriales bacterium]